MNLLTLSIKILLKIIAGTADTNLVTDFYTVNATFLHHARPAVLTSEVNTTLSG